MIEVEYRHAPCRRAAWRTVVALAPAIAAARPALRRRNGLGKPRGHHRRTRRASSPLPLPCSRQVPRSAELPLAGRPRQLRRHWPVPIARGGRASPRSRRAARISSDMHYRHALITWTFPRHLPAGDVTRRFDPTPSSSTLARRRSAAVHRGAVTPLGVAAKHVGLSAAPERSTRRAERSAAHRREAGARRRLLRHHGAPARGGSWRCATGGQSGESPAVNMAGRGPASAAGAHPI